MSDAPARGAVPVPADAAPGIARRLASMLYEAILLFAVAFLATWLFQFAAGTLRIEGWRMHLLQLFLLAVFAAYFLWCWLRGGQTLAMKTWRIRLVARHGHGAPRRRRPRCCASSTRCCWCRR